MAEEIEKHYTIDFQKSVGILAQNKLAKFEHCAAYVKSGVKGKGSVPVEQFGIFDLQPNNNRYKDTELKDIARERRWYFPHKDDGAIGLDSADDLRIDFDEKTPIVNLMVLAINRAKNRRFIRGYFGTNYVGEDGTTTRAFDSNMIVPHSASTSICQKIDMGLGKMLENGIELEDEEIFMALPQSVETLLKQDAHYISADYMSSKVLSGKNLIPYSGVNMIRYNDSVMLSEVLQYTDGGHTYVRCPIWCKSGMAIGRWGSDYTIKTGERADKSYAWQAYTEITQDATRVDEKKCGQIIVQIS